MILSECVDLESLSTIDTAGSKVLDDLDPVMIKYPPKTLVRACMS